MLVMLDVKCMCTSYGRITAFVPQMQSRRPFAQVLDKNLRRKLLHACARATVESDRRILV